MTHWDSVSKGPSGPVKFYVAAARRDGKHLVTMCYARQLRKLCTADQVAGFDADDSIKVIRR